MIRHLLDIAPLSAGDVRRLLDEAHRRKAARAGKPKGAADDDAPLAGHALAMVFQKNSTRTRISFDIGMRQLGGQSLVMSAADTQLGRGETIADTARVLSRMVDCVMIRANAHQDLVEFAEYSSAPLINGLSDRSHPCQILADLMTIEERIGALKGKTIAWLGDGNNVCLSFIHAAPKLGFTMRVATPAHYAADAVEIAAARAEGAEIIVGENADAAVEGADVVVTDTWVSMGDTDKDARMRAFPPFAVDEARMARAAKGAVFLHCLPAHRNEEVTDAVMDGPQSAVWDEAENRIHAQKAVLLCVSASFTDDLIAAFGTDAAPARGRIARLGAGTIDPILRRHDYPTPVALLLGETLLFAALMGALLKVEGRLIVQAQGDGLAPLLVAEHRTGGALRGYARVNDAARAAFADAHRLAPRDVVGAGVLAVTLDRGEGYALHQGYVPLESDTLAQCAEAYFRDSEQTEARLRLAVGQVIPATGPAQYRAGGALVQKIAGDAARGDTEDEWRAVTFKFDLLTDAELLDPDLPADRVLYRLFHEEGVRMSEPATLRDECACNEERLAAVLRSFKAEEISDLIEPDGFVRVNCQFCARSFKLDPAALA